MQFFTLIIIYTIYLIYSSQLHKRQVMRRQRLRKVNILANMTCFIQSLAI